MHGSSLRSSLPEEILEVMHLNTLVGGSYTVLREDRNVLSETHIRQLVDRLLYLRFLT